MVTKVLAGGLLAWVLQRPGHGSPRTRTRLVSDPGARVRGAEADWAWATWVEALRPAQSSGRVAAALLRLPSQASRLASGFVEAPVDVVGNVEVIEWGGVSVMAQGG